MTSKNTSKTAIALAIRMTRSSRPMLPILSILLIVSAAVPLAAQRPRREEPKPSDEPTMYWEAYEPRTTLVVPQHPVTRTRFPFVDVHSHQWGDLPEEQVDRIVADMDAMNMAVMVNLSGGTGERLIHTIEALEGRYPDRFVVFANVDFEAIDDPDFAIMAAAQLERDVAAGARGLKIYKNLGMTLKDGTGTRIPTDDPRLDPIWAKCGELGIPVLIHTGEPAEFFQPQDEHNERWFELKQRPNRARPPSEFPLWETIMQEQWRMFAKHPDTNFISAHMSWLAGDLGRLGTLLDTMPNMYVEIGAILAELGRQPRFARQWFSRYQDRVMFGKDSWRPEEYPYYFRTLETADEYFDYYRKRHAFWKLYGLDLPDRVLKKLYHVNAARLIPGLALDRFQSEPSVALGAGDRER